MNIPNLLSLLRLCMVPLFPIVFFSDIPYANLWSAAIYALASFTDILDGYLARKLQMVTKLGRILDPLADKLMSATVIICLSIQTPILWWAAGLVCLKESMMGIGALVQYKKISDVPPAEFIGKFSTFFFFGVCLLILLVPTLPAWLMLALVGTATALSLLAFCRYMIRFIKLMREKK